ncbi:hypothetical protein GWG65_38960 [Bradyrhizobium sp. CSA207]|nr:hypothetical protein [Bradyrhizobium sp. CSA207]MDE5447186.1 hypothetical protein [Bradyrhizobium sp. CSA207]
MTDKEWQNPYQSRGAVGAPRGPLGSSWLLFNVVALAGIEFKHLKNYRNL